MEIKIVPRTRSTLRRGSSNNTAIPAAEFLINFSKAGFMQIQGL
ncbi:MAG: hypothetical protein U0V04_13425 [Spirosomataceae bacterium]